jgi:hypothetical protein
VTGPITSYSAAAGKVTEHVRVDWAGVASAPWFGLPPVTDLSTWKLGAATTNVVGFHLPSFNLAFVLVSLPVVIALIAENTGHVKAVAEMTKEPLDAYMGRAIAADGAGSMIATMAGAGPTTTYAENIGVMAATKVYSTLAYVVAALVAILFGLSPKFGAVISATPGGVLGGITVVLYGMIGLLGAKIWIENRVDFGNPVNLVPMAAAIIIGNVWLKVTRRSAGGIAFGTIGGGPTTWPRHSRRRPRLVEVPTSSSTAPASTTETTSHPPAEPLLSRQHENGPACETGGPHRSGGQPQRRPAIGRLAMTDLMTAPVTRHPRRAPRPDRRRRRPRPPDGRLPTTAAALLRHQWGVVTDEQSPELLALGASRPDSAGRWRKQPALRLAFLTSTPTRSPASTMTTCRACSRTHRQPAEIEAVIANAAATVRLRADGGLPQLVWHHMPATTPVPRTQQELPKQTEASERLADALRARGFRLVGPVTMHFLMAAAGVVDCHLVGSHRRGCSGLFTRSGRRRARPVVP